MKQVFAFSAVALSLALAACGGGGGDSTSTSAPVATPTPVPTPTPTPIPTVQNPQAGSTAAVGNGIEGYWTTALSLLSPTSSVKSIAIVAPDGQLQAFSYGANSYYTGTLSFSGTSWSAAGESIINSTDGAYSDSGTFVAKTSITDPSNSALTFDTYANANGLAVTQGDLIGTWGSALNKITVNGSGSFTGTSNVSGTCNVTGSITQYDASSSKNIFRVAFTTSQGVGTTCNAPAGQTYTGLAVIDLINAGSTASPNYVRTLEVIASVPHASYLWLQLPKN
ncbi:hypothetical protein HNQ50_003499 [Silvimonas terrae]|uniref:Uncharacterized protein n=1 Tax=Silvimonas terrae TaxID=300266 RepID=A0A840RHE2_9NEIS|nr:hypothetical protein [Silvimonas terrae]MBB5192745.1 hypothetical protein [Silvimonas terrae]